MDKKGPTGNSHWKGSARDPERTREQILSAALKEFSAKGFAGAGVANIRSRQQRGYIAPELDPRHVLLAMVSLTTYALAFPQVARLITGLGPDDPRFRVERTAFLRWMGSALRPGSGERRGREMAQRRKIKGPME